MAREAVPCRLDRKNETTNGPENLVFAGRFLSIRVGLECRSRFFDLSGLTFPG